MRLHSKEGCLTCSLEQTSAIFLSDQLCRGKNPCIWWQRHVLSGRSVWKEMTDRDRGCWGKASHLSSLCQGDGGMKLSFSFAPPLALLLRSQLNPHQPALVHSNAGFVSSSSDTFCNSWVCKSCTALLSMNNYQPIWPNSIMASETDWWFPSGLIVQIGRGGGGGVLKVFCGYLTGS